MTSTDTTVETPAPTVWPTLQARDARALIGWLTTIVGFEETAVFTDAGGAVVHAQLRWPEGGGLMLADHEASGDCARQTGAFGAYVVTDHVADLYERAKAAGAAIVRELADQVHGQPEFTVADPEGNLWSFGPYRGEPHPTRDRRGA
ncbi:putative glyoxalase superfamily protein PhnB [Prauserella shujinwangii]|uniref:Putative glyoxalase superfamily protein PhnB n=1 Tax=Prauserella shujinwangii TaxID=1453103 RepID=A0A2T0LKA6_9PSEU|nr:VOC family protein [Prauserella shujinwangii]PRX43273.1 putative glyoxalase superfamily protein PhnB [Prauserella shujinwangii]